MNNAPSGHLTRQVLRSFGLGKLDERSAEAVSKHLEQCPDCRKQVAEISADSLLGCVRGVQVPATSTYSQSQLSGGASGPGTSKGRCITSLPRIAAVPGGPPRL